MIIDSIQNQERSIKKINVQSFLNKSFIIVWLVLFVFIKVPLSNLKNIVLRAFFPINSISFIIFFSVAIFIIQALLRPSSDCSSLSFVLEPPLLLRSLFFSIFLMMLGLGSFENIHLIGRVVLRGLNFCQSNNISI